MGEHPLVDTDEMVTQQGFYSDLGDEVRILYLDDDPDIAERVATVLAENRVSFDVVTESDPQDAFDRLGDADVDCVVIGDLSDLDGPEVREQVRQADSDVPFIRFTDAETEDSVSDASSQDDTDTFQKGDETDQFEVLASRIETAVVRHRARTTIEELSVKEQAMDEAPLGIVITDPGVDDNPIVYANDGFVRLTGYPRAEVIGQNCRFLQGDATDGEPVAAMREAIADEEPVTVELRNYRKDGEMFWNRVSIAPIRDQDGEVSHFVGFQQDVSGWRRRQTVLEALHEFATTIQTDTSVETACERTVDVAADILEFDMCTVVLQDGEWLVPYATSRDAPAGGSRRMRVDQGLAGKTFQTGESYVIDQVTLDDEADPAKETYRSGISVPVGERGVFQAVSTDPEAFDSQAVEFAELLVSHTANAIDRIEREAALTRQNEQLEEFASIVSHDLRNPLNVAMLQLELVRDEFESDHLDAAERAHERMEALVEDMLTLAREGSRVDEKEAVSLADLAESCWGTVETGTARLTVTTDRTVRADRSRLKQLFENLIRNAVEHGSTSPRSHTHEDAVEHGSTDSDSQTRPDASEHGDCVTITVGTLDDETGFYVEDDGPGIPPEERERVFDAGYSTSEEGTGFGLRIVKQVAEAHGWNVRVTEGTTGGARFEITGVEFVG